MAVHPMSRALARADRAPNDFYRTPEALVAAIVKGLPIGNRSAGLPIGNRSAGLPIGNRPAGLPIGNRPAGLPIGNRPAELPFAQWVLDPCAGDGVFGRAIREHHPGVSLREIDVAPSGAFIESLDFFMINTGDIGTGGLIVGNPPYGLAQQFICHALDLSPHVVFLLRLNFLEGQKRRAFWREHPASHVAVLPRRPSFTGKGTDATAYAVFTWGPRAKGSETTLSHLDW